MSPQAPAVQPGQFAPDFTLKDDSGGERSLAQLRTHWVVLYFYPKDDTPGWTAEACAFRDALPRFEGLDAVILGVSTDSVKKHQNFKRKYNLPFTLLADTDHRVAEQYGVWAEKMMFGKKYWGIVRTTFIIDPSGRIARVLAKLEPEDHAAEARKALEELSAQRPQR